MEIRQDPDVRIVTAGHVQLAAQSFGSAGCPALLLIMGATASMLGWPDGFCERLAEAGFHVIRFDNRDTGRSTSEPPGSPSYSLTDMADDALRILDEFGCSSAHVVGMSLGGMIGQIAALKNPGRVNSLTVIASGRFDEPDDSLPGISPEFMDLFTALGRLDWADRDAVVQFWCDRARLLAGSAFSFNEAEARRQAEREFDYARQPQSAFNHTMLTGGDGGLGGFGSIKAPLLIVHGTEDPVLPLPHAHSMKSARPDATLLLFERRGHELHYHDWDEIACAIAKHAAEAVDPAGS